DQPIDRAEMGKVIGTESVAQASRCPVCACAAVSGQVAYLAQARTQDRFRPRSDRASGLQAGSCRVSLEPSQRTRSNLKRPSGCRLCCTQLGVALAADVADHFSYLSQQLRQPADWTVA